MTHDVHIPHSLLLFPALLWECYCFVLAAFFFFFYTRHTTLDAHPCRLAHTTCHFACMNIYPTMLLWTWIHQKIYFSYSIRCVCLVCCLVCKSESDVRCAERCIFLEKKHYFCVFYMRRKKAGKIICLTHYISIWCCSTEGQICMRNRNCVLFSFAIYSHVFYCLLFFPMNTMFVFLHVQIIIIMILGNSFSSTLFLSFSRTCIVYSTDEKV